MEFLIYLGIKLKYFDRDKQYIQDWAATIVENILSNIDRRFGKLGGSSHDITAEVKEGDNILFHICRILNTNVKSNLRCSLRAEILNALMRIKISGPSLEDFSSQHCKVCVDRWYTAKNRRTHQKKRKTHKDKEQHHAKPNDSSCSSDDSNDDNME